MVFLLMCGIAGVVKLNRFLAGMPQCRKVEAILSGIKHRGPDDTHSLSGDVYVVGANRLAIVDQENGRQPVRINEGREITVALNGEVYNHMSLRNEWAVDAHYRSSCDTESIAYLVSRLGIEAVSHFNGMFAIFIQDGDKSYLVRDRYGVKPLYYAVEGNELTFSSELKSFLSMPFEVRLTDDYFEFEDVLFRNTPIRGVSQVQMGHMLVIDHLEGRIYERPYYSLSANHTPVVSEEQYVGQFRSLLLDSVALRANTDVPYAAAVSGGLDSSLVAAVARPESVISVEVPDSFSDERVFFQTAIADLDATCLSCLPDVIRFPKQFVQMVRAIDYPVGTLAAYSQFVVSQKLAEQGYRIVLSGLGADEYLAGYVRHIILMLGPKRVSTLPQFAHYGPLVSKAMSLVGDGSVADRYYALVSRVSESQRSDQVRHLVHQLVESNEPIASSLARVDMHLSLPPLLRVDDRINMYFGIEGRAPFLDYRMVDYAMCLPDAMKLRDIGSHVISKHVLREAIEGIIPESIRTRKDKVGFPSPILGWLRGYYRHAVVHAKIFLSHTAPHLYQRLDGSGDMGSFSRKDWLLLQWAVWYMAFYFGLPDDEIIRLIFSDSKDVRPLLSGFPVAM